MGNVGWQLIPGSGDEKTDSWGQCHGEAAGKYGGFAEYKAVCRDLGGEFPVQKYQTFV